MVAHRLAFSIAPPGPHDPPLPQAFLLFLASYCVFLWIYGEVSGVWRYGLNWTTPRGVAGEVVLVVLALLVFLCW